LARIGHCSGKTVVTIMEFGEEIHFTLLAVPAGPVLQVQEWWWSF